jgi:hypothetical protein
MLSLSLWERVGVRGILKGDAVVESLDVLSVCIGP